MASSPIPQTLRLLDGAEAKIGKIRALIGLDGFVDSIIRVVDKRYSLDSFDAIDTIAALAERIGRAAGKSTNLEFVTEKQKLGGNGPIMANALAMVGVKLRCLGNLGFPKVHSVFADMATRCEMVTVAEPGYTDALEFDDGKLMLTRSQSLRDVSWSTLKHQVGGKTLLQFFDEADFIALNNWTQLPCMSDIWQEIQKDIVPRLSAKSRTLFFDLADPQKRTPDDVKRALSLIAKFQGAFRVILGLNESEGYQIAHALGIPVEGDGQDAIVLLAKRIREKLGISIVVIHPRMYAAAADLRQAIAVDGPFCEKPLISTGAGDHFNAGFCLGVMLTDDLELALQIGVATSGFYVRNASSPTIADLKLFLSELSKT